MTNQTSLQSPGQHSLHIVGLQGKKSISLLTSSLGVSLAKQCSSEQGPPRHRGKISAQTNHHAGLCLHIAPGLRTPLDLWCLVSAAYPTCLISIHLIGIIDPLSRGSTLLAPV